MPRHWPLSIAVLVATLAAAAPAAITIVSLPAGTSMGTTRLSGDGSVLIGSYSVGVDTAHAYRWTTQDGRIDLPAAPGFPYANARAASADGSVIAGSVATTYYGTGIQPAIWRGNAAPQLLPIPSPNSGVNGLSDDGLVATGTYLVSHGRHAYRWTSGGIIDILVPGADTYSVAISGDGSTVVGDSQSVSQRAYRWAAAGGTQDLGDLGGSPTTAASDVNGDGSVVVGYSYDATGGQRAFRWTAAGMQNLGTLPGPFRPGQDDSEAIAVSANGNTIVGQAQDALGFLHAMMWTPSLGMVDLNEYLPSIGIGLNGYILESSTGLSNDGLTITGFTSTAPGHPPTLPWIVTIPSPSSLVLFPLVMALTSCRRAQRRRALPNSLASPV